MSDKKKNQKQSPSPIECSEKAMFTNPVASATDATGYGTSIPMNTDEAEALSDLVNAPATAVDSDNPNANLESEPR